MIFGDISFGDTPLVAGVVFHNDDAARDFINGLPAGNWRDGGGDWPSQAGLVASAASAISAGRGGSAAMGLQSAVDNVSRLQPFGLGGRSSSQDSQYRGAMIQLRSLLSQVAASGGAAVPGAAYPQGAGAAGGGMGFGIDTNMLMLLGVAGLAVVLILKKRRSAPAAAAPAPVKAVAGYRRRKARR